MKKEASLPSSAIAHKHLRVEVTTNISGTESCPERYFSISPHSAAEDRRTIFDSVIIAIWRIAVTLLLQQFRENWTSKSFETFGNVVQSLLICWFNNSITNCLKWTSLESSDANFVAISMYSGRLWNRCNWISPDLLIPWSWCWILIKISSRLPESEVAMVYFHMVCGQSLIWYSSERLYPFKHLNELCSVRRVWDGIVMELPVYEIDKMGRRWGSSGGCQLCVGKF